MAELSQFLKLQTDYRKLRLFAVACCYEILDIAKDPQSIQALQIAEKHADKKATDNELVKAYRAAFDIAANLGYEVLHDPTLEIEYSAASAIACATSYDATYKILYISADNAAYNATQAITHNAAYKALQAMTQYNPLADCKMRQIMIAHDIFGPTKTVIPTTKLIQEMARTIYQYKAWKVMPILADALEDTNNDINETVLNHLRDPHQIHYRGCWVLDTILGQG